MGDLGCGGGREIHSNTSRVPHQAARGAAGRGGAEPGGEVAGGAKAGQHHSDPRTPSPPCGDAYSPAAKAQCSCPQNGDQHLPVVDSAESQQNLTPTLQLGAGFISRSSGGQQ